MTTLKKSAKKLFLIALLATLLTAGARSSYAYIKYIGVDYDDGSFFGISCGSTAGPVAIYYEASENRTYILGPAQPSQCTGGSSQ